MGEINTKRFEWCIRDFYEIMGLLKNELDRTFFENVLIGVGLSKTSIEAYLHGFLNTYIFEQQEKTLVYKLNNYRTELKLLKGEFLEYRCWHCHNEVKMKELKNYECELCNHSPMFRIPIYKVLYERDYKTRKLDVKNRYNLLDL